MFVMTRLGRAAAVLVALAGAAAGQTLMALHPGAAQGAMAGADVALAWDAYGVFYNPAGAALFSGANAGFGFNRISDQGPTRWNGSLVVLPRCGVAVGAFGQGERLDETEYSSRYVYHAWEAGLNAAWLPVRWLAVGGNCKYSGVYIMTDDPYHAARTYTASAFAMDVGVLVRGSPTVGELRVGASLLNSGTKLHWGEPNFADQSLPWFWRAGGAWVLRATDIAPGVRLGGRLPDWFGSSWLADNWRFCLTADAEKAVRSGWRSGTYSFGAELRPVPFVALRCGWRETVSAGYIHGEPTWGVGLDLRYVRFDVCDDGALYIVPPPTGRRTLRWSVSVNLGEPLVRLSADR
jgi:hypothetical protein